MAMVKIEKIYIILLIMHKLIEFVYGDMTIEMQEE